MCALSQVKSYPGDYPSDCADLLSRLETSFWCIILINFIQQENFDYFCINQKKKFMYNILDTFVNSVFFNCTSLYNLL